MIVFEAKPFHRPETAEQRFLPEGPTQLLKENGSRSSKLAWVSIQNSINTKTGSLNILDLSNHKNENYPLDGRPGFLAQSRLENRLYIGLEYRIVLFDLDTREITWEGPGIVSNSHTAINDGFAFSGGLIFGTKDCRFEEAIAHLYYFEIASGDLHILADGQTCSNGKFTLPGRSENELLLFDIDTPSRTLVRYNFNLSLRTLQDKKVILDLTKRSDFPDGMRLCPGDKSVVIAFYNPADVENGLAQQFNLNTGEIEAEWRLPKSPRVTCPEFVMIDGKVKLIFTTADEGLSPEKQSLHSEAGSLFIADTGFKNMPESRPFLP